MTEIKRSQPDYPIDDLIAERWSPYVFDSRPVAAHDLKALFEAARWAPSSYNEQPWRYIVATNEHAEEFERLLSCLVEGNQAWAKHAPVLALGVVSLLFDRNGKPNSCAQHDLGLASATLLFEATKRGLSVHQMVGILPERAMEVYNVPADFQVMTGIAIGYRGSPDAGDEKLAERDRAPRTRRAITEFVFSGNWGQSFDSSS